MISMPRNSLKTAQDFERMHALAVSGELKESCTECLKVYWQSLLNGQYRYDRTRKLEAGEEPAGGEPDYKVIDEPNESGEVERWQYDRVIDDRSRINALGFTPEYVQTKIDELEQL
ncbi:hypothetical protein [Idiomarina sp.]|uniref:hypothetical protein n=1 Tax=Idiomarina sp. TaxID=1874361 RepID=UPI003A902512